MKKIYFLFIATFILSGVPAFAQTFCNQSGNVVIYSNYDGGAVTINVDQNIPNLKIGIVSYEFSRITITGTYVGNVTAVRWAGYNGTNNHCNLSQPYNTTITGVPNNVDTIIIYPSVAFSNPNGSNHIVCNYSCDDSTNQGGCNTPDQLAYYFLTAFGETNSSLYFHLTHYGCWPATVNISDGGNCCSVPSITSMESLNASATTLSVSPNPSAGNFHVALPEGISNGEIKIFNMMGEEIRSVKILNSTDISLEGEASGIYFLKLTSGKETYSQRIVLTE